jgi:hypothetical protein
VVLIGGYGEDFKSPHSIFVNYYYLLRFQIPTNRLLTIHKKYIKGKVVPINTQSPIKNRGTFSKINILDPSHSEKTPKCIQTLSTNHHYFLHRVIYALQNGNLHSKVKTNLGVELYNNCKKEYVAFGQVVGEVRVVREVEPVLVRWVEDNRHHVVVEVKDRVFLFRVVYEWREARRVNVTGR